MNFTLLLIIGIGGFFGAISRFLLSSFVQRTVSPTLFPIGTLSVNIVGSFLIGIMVVIFENISAPEYKALIMTGFLGALTTFSTFSLESVIMLQDGDYYRLFLNIFLNVLLSLSATIIAIFLMKKFFI